MTNADKIMNPQHSRSNLADIWICINPEIGIQILDQITFFDILALAEFALSECSCAVVTVIIKIAFLPRDAKQVRSMLSCSVCPSVTFVDHVKMNKFFHHWVATPF